MNEYDFPAIFNLKKDKFKSRLYSSCLHWMYVEANSLKTAFKMAVNIRILIRNN